MLLASIAFSYSLGGVPHQELPATFEAGRVFAMPRVSNSDRRLVLWIDSDGSGFLRGDLVNSLKLQTTAANDAYLPNLDERGFPGIAANHGALPVLAGPQAAIDPLLHGIDGQLGWSWLDGRIWTFDYVGHHLYQDYSAPPYHPDQLVPLRFDAQRRYPQLEIAIAGKTYSAALDTAASIALSDTAANALNDGLPRIRATSFIPRATMDAWRAAHPDWQYIPNAGIGPGIAMIRVPQVTAARVTFTNVWFSTRPKDDVFQGDNVQAKLGAGAFGNCAMTIDYVHAQAGFACST